MADSSSNHNSAVKNSTTTPEELSEASKQILKSCSQIEQLQQELGPILPDIKLDRPKNKPIPAARRATLQALFPPENLLNRTNSPRLPISDKEDTNKFKTTYDFNDYKDFASAVNPTAPRVLAPISPSLKSPPPNTVRGPKGVNGPQLKELLEICKAKSKRKNSGSIKSVDQVDVSEEVTIETKRLSSGSRTSSSTDSSTDYRDAYAELVKELNRHEALVTEKRNQLFKMPVHETAFLQERGPPMWHKRSTNPPAARDSEGCTTTDDEFDSVPLRRTYSSRNYGSPKINDIRIRSFSPPPILVRPVATPAGNPILVRPVATPAINPKLAEETRRLQVPTEIALKNYLAQTRSQSPAIISEQQRVNLALQRSAQQSAQQHIAQQHIAQQHSPQQHLNPVQRSASPHVSQVQRSESPHFNQIQRSASPHFNQIQRSASPHFNQIQRSSSPLTNQIQRSGSPLLVSPTKQPLYGVSPLVRGSPMRSSIGSGRGGAQYYRPIQENQQQEEPVMQRSYSLNAENIRDLRRGTKSATLPNQSNGHLVDSTPKRVSFSNPGNTQSPSRPTRPSSSDSVFLYSPIGEAPEKPLPPVPEDRATPQGRYQQNDQRVKPQARYQVVKGTPTGYQVMPQGRQPPTRSDERLTPQARWNNQQRYHPSPESESGSEAGEIQRILFKQPAPSYISFQDDEWTSDGKSRGPPGSDHSAPPGSRDEDVRRGGAGSRNRRDEPRRHTLSGDQQASAASNLSRSMDLESAALQRSYYHQPPPISSSMFDDDPGIMSEVETASTGFRRGGKQRSSLPVVRTPSKTLERPLGLVFLQYRNETKRALLPNEITSIDTVKALFVRSFPKQLTMEYLDSHMVKIYIHDSSKDMFYELEDLRSHLRDIRDRSVLRLFETPDINGGAGGGVPVGGTPMPGGLPPHPSPAAWDQDQSYFSEPEFDSEYQHQHIHKTKGSSNSKSGGGGGSPYYMAHSYPPGQPGGGGSATLPRGAPPVIRAYSPATKTVSQADRLHTESGYMSSPERGRPPYAAYPAAGAYEDPYYQYGPRSGSITPVIDEEASDSDELLMDPYSIYSSSKSASAGARIQQPSPRPPSFPSTGNIASQSTAALVPYDATRIRVEHMERQLANLTGLVQKALTGPRDFLQIPGTQRDAYRNADTKPTKPAIKSSTLPRTSSQERDRHKPAPPPKPMSLSTHQGQYDSSRHLYRADLQLTPEMYNHLRVLQKKAKDLRQEVRNLRRMSQAQAHSVRESIRDTFIKIRAMLLTGGGDSWLASGDTEKLRVSREEELYKQEMLRLEKDLTELESTVEELRGNVINKKTRVNMSDVENMALVLSKSSKTVADLKVRFPSLQDGMKTLLGSEMEKVVREEKFLKEEPERLESALRRCKKLTGTLVTLKRLASVQEQRLPIVVSNNDPQNQRLSPDNLLQEVQQTGAISPQSKCSGDGCISPGSSSSVSTRSLLASTGTGNGSGGETSKRQENALDTLLDELQTFARPPSDRHGSIDMSTPTPPPSSGTLRRLHSYPSSDSSSPVRSAPITTRLQVSDDSKPPSLPERSKVPPPPPPRTSSRSPLVSPTSPPRLGPRLGTGGTLLRRKRDPPAEPENNNKPLSSNSSSSESINSQEGLRGSEALEQRHQELLRRQRQLQEQYARLQQLQRNVRLPQAPELKKTGSESNLLRGLNLSAAPTSGSLTHLAPTSILPIANTSSKIYETDIL